LNHLAVAASRGSRPPLSSLRAQAWAAAQPSPRQCHRRRSGEAGEGIAIIPSFGLPACRSRKLTTSELIEPVVTLEFHQISHRGRKLPEEAEEFSAFLKKYIAVWAGEGGIL
jgi:DNA-binding transcriptional LysR family regulator